MKPLVYTQRSVAFPSLPAYDRELDDLNVEGPQSSIKFAWIELSTYDGGALKVEAFSDSFATLHDPRVVRVIAKIRAARRSHKDVPPSRVIKWLEEEGAVASVYHLRGLDTGNLTLAEKAELERRMETARRYE